MEISKFFFWLSQKYPSAIVKCVENKPIIGDSGVQIPFDTWEDNPNCAEFDNLYLDLNDILHSCTDPDDKPVPKNEEEIIEILFEYIDRLFRIVRPRKLLYMAVDGAVPLAKINQQRSRSFKAAKEAKEKSSEIAKIRSELILKGACLPPVKAEENFDSNCIIPGTSFMSRLTDHLRYYIHDRMNNIPGWNSVIIILSDFSVPGEGKHKIADYIRRQKAHPNYNPTSEHVIYGNDDELIMLGLATHEPCRIMREAFKSYKLRPCDVCGKSGHVMQDCLGIKSSLKVENKPAASEEECPFVFIRMHTLRECLKQELLMLQLPFKYSFERALDDWVFMCLFVGNNYLPHLPCFELRDNAIDGLINLYKNIMYRSDGYLTANGDLNLGRVQLIINAMTEDEEYFLQKQRHKMAIPLGKKRKHDDIMEVEIGSDEEAFKLWISEYKDIYYNTKFQNPPKEKLDILKNSLVSHYVQGLCWVLRYYYQGVPSWKWYYPYHWAPFASDFNFITNISKKFEKGTAPLRPLEQLMWILPSASSKHVPAPWARLMRDPASPIINFYPEEFRIEEGVAVLPFIDKKRLFNALKPHYSLLTESERKCNIRGQAKLYIGPYYDRDYRLLISFYKDIIGDDNEIFICIDNSIRGIALKAKDCVPFGATLPSPLNYRLPVTNNNVICIIFKNIKYSDNHVFISQELEGAKKPPAIKNPPHSQTVFMEE